jgi:glucose-1-phosphate adenylyltransferase
MNGIPGSTSNRKEDLFLASMGIYVFNRDLLTQLLNNDDHTDFGKHIIPESIKARRVYSYVFQGYWEDIGTIRAFFEANLNWPPSSRASTSST